MIDGGDRGFWTFIAAGIALLTTLIIEVARSRRHKQSIKYRKGRRKLRKRLKSAAQALQRVQEIEQVLERYKALLERLEIAHPAS